MVWTDRQRAPQTTGALATAGGIVFDGSLDRYMRAYDESNGKVLWETRLNDMPSSCPITYSVNGKQYVAVVVGNGSATVRNAPNYNSVFGKLVIFKREGGKLTHVTDGQIGHACQGVVWSEDGKRLLVQCSVERDIRTLDFDGKTLTERPDAVIKMQSRPGVMVTSRAR